MANLMTSVNRDLRARLTNWITQLETNAEVLDAAPLEDVRAQLRAAHIDVQRFQRKLAQTLATAKVRQVGAMLLKWVSPVWQPQWAGQMVTAGDIPEQSRTFAIPGGEVAIRCSWKPALREMPAYLDFSWRCDTVSSGEIWCQFIQPETHDVLAEISLGAHQAGGKYLTAETLGFDPSTQVWAIIIVVKEPVQDA